jgi:hypothetical protein
MVEGNRGHLPENLEEVVEDKRCVLGRSAAAAPVSRCDQVQELLGIWVVRKAMEGVLQRFHGCVVLAFPDVQQRQVGIREMEAR